MRYRNVLVGLIAGSLVLGITCIVFALPQSFQPFQGQEAERFLTEAKFVRLGRTLGGVTRPRQATLEMDGVMHFGVFKTIDQNKPGITQLERGEIQVDFQDSWRTEIPAYEMDKLLGLGMVPVTVERTYNGARGSLQAWVDFAMSEAERVAKKVQPPDPEAWNRQIFKVRMFDNLIYNTDRHLNNIWITQDWKIILIDHSRTFRRLGQLRNEKDLTRFSKSLLESMAKLDKVTLDERLKKHLNTYQIESILKRRDLILKRAEKLVAEKGEAAVLFP